ncbi:MAG: hypothetical protein NC924_05535 [Candidatus Omnitrophica bacterium]|nr:hypothetical protein [Candidatus Omnitrophota bacterium]
MPNVYAVYVQYGAEHQQSGAETLENFLHTAFPQKKVETVIVDNALTHETEFWRRAHLNIISGDNRCREFSGYERGIDWVERAFALRDEDTLIIANDTFHRSYGKEYLAWFIPEIVEMALADGKIVGYMDAYPEETQICGLPLRRWIRTSCFAARRGVFRRLMPLCFPLPDSEIFSQDYREFFCASAPLSNNYKQFQRTWLFGEHTAAGNFREAWHHQAALTADNWQSFKEKMRCILSEHYFSARAQQAGIGLLDVKQFRSLAQRLNGS